MKKTLLSLFLLSLLIFNASPASALKYEEAVSAQKPAAILIYADWIDDYNKVLNAFGSYEQNYGKNYNFVLLNIASPDAKPFNKKYNIYPNLPYVLLFKDNGRVSRYIQKHCLLDSSCMNEKLRFFIN